MFMNTESNAITRRRFLGTTATVAAGWSAMPVVASRAANEQIPAHLADYETLYGENPRAAALQWFRDAKSGLFLHYSRRSMVPNAEAQTELSAKAGNRGWLAGAREHFTAEKFDAEAIAELAVEAGMKYVNMTTYHNSGPFLFRTSVSKDNTAEGPAGRDLIGEMSEACARHGLGMFMYIYPTHVESSSERAEDNRTILRELLTQYGPIAGIWFDGIYRAYRERHLFEGLQDHYDMVRELQPHALISFKVGYTGGEDFLAPEHFPRTITGNNNLPEAVREDQKTWPVEICTSLQVHPDVEYGEKTGPGQGIWLDRDDARHLSSNEVLARLKSAWAHPANLLLNTGLIGDGSVHPEDKATLQAVGQTLRDQQ